MDVSCAELYGGRSPWALHCHMTTSLPALAVALSLTSALPALAQRAPFERTLDATGIVTLDVLTERGAIDIAGGEPGKIVVSGAATVRLSWNVPADAPALARQVAANPPIERDGNVLRLRPPADARTRDAVTVRYRVYVPPGVTVVTTAHENYLYGMTVSSFARS